MRTDEHPDACCCMDCLQPDDMPILPELPIKWGINSGDEYTHYWKGDSIGGHLLDVANTGTLKHSCNIALVTCPNCLDQYQGAPDTENENI